MTLLHLEVPPNALNVRKVRAELVRVASDISMSKEALQDFVTAVGEALANAIEHAITVDPIEIDVKTRRKGIVAVVRDHGRGIDPLQITDRLPPATSEHGRGIPLMARCVSSMAISQAQDGGTIIELRWGPSRLQARRPRSNSTGNDSPIAPSVSSTSVGLSAAQTNITSF
jgi:anti-sigma regulatory factor (Ser/Thr protein kinase)